jgi:hypothetical protein
MATRNHLDSAATFLLAIRLWLPKIGRRSQKELQGCSSLGVELGRQPAASRLATGLRCRFSLEVVLQ